tara:strand:+ start:67 stop:225 length:159 start_codon:yes stop_codon:yes gene_type:complete
MKEEEYSVKIEGSWSVMANSRKDAEEYIMSKFRNGDTNYTEDVEIIIDEGKE